MRLAYVILSYLLAPFVAGFLVWRGLRNRAYLDRFGERFGFGHDASGPGIWVHAVSVGEVQAAVPLVRSLLERYPGVPLHVTTVTPTGAARVAELFGDRVQHRYAPYDLPGSVRRFFDRVKPRVAIILETELWPNLYHECGRRGVPLVLASARISPRSVAKYQRFIGLFREALSHGIVIAAQSDEDAERFRALGANPGRTHVTGNIKFDFELPDAVRQAGEAFRNSQVADRPVVVAGSTHDPEESIVLDAMDRLRGERPDLLLVLVPRHPERFDAVARLVRDRGLSLVTRSSGEACTAATQVFLVDTLGELTRFYAAGDVAFVGGSLVPVGGHNLLEPAALGKPIITGPYTFNAESIAAMLLDGGAASQVSDAGEMAERIGELLGDPVLRDRCGAIGLETVRANRGALAQLLALLEPLLDEMAR